MRLKQTEGRREYREKATEVSRAQSMEGLISCEETFVFFSKHNGKPSEGFEQESFMI